MVSLRPWTSLADTIAVQRCASRLWPLGMHPGDLAWHAATDQLPEKTILAVRSGEVIGWAGLTGRELTVQSLATDLSATGALFEWGLTEAGSSDIALAMPHDHYALRSLALDAGFWLPEQPTELLGMVRQATIEESPLPVGYRIRSIQGGEDTARVEMHRAAGHLAYALTRAQLERLRQMWLYNQQLDLVVEAPGGALVACCTAWWDAANASTQLKPLAVVPSHRRKGLAPALCMAVSTMTALRGGKQLGVDLGGRGEDRVSLQPLRRAGFEVVSRGWLYQRKQSV